VAHVARREDEGLARGDDAVDEHVAPFAGHHAHRQAALVRLPGDHRIAAVLGEELDPVLEPVLVEQFPVTGIELVNGILHHRPITSR
jgi:hypothetical protein